MQGSLNEYARKFNKGGVLISAYQRIIWFHNRVVENAYPNAGTLAEQFEISNRQAQRDIEYMRDSMNAPLLYCVRKRGYEDLIHRVHSMHTTVLAHGAEQL